jgi:hypothetical protein
VVKRQRNPSDGAKALGFRRWRASPPAFYDFGFVKLASGHPFRSVAGLQALGHLKWAPKCLTTFYPSAPRRPTYSCMR